MCYCEEILETTSRLITCPIKENERNDATNESNVTRKNTRKRKERINNKFAINVILNPTYSNKSLRTKNS